MKNENFAPIETVQEQKVFFFVLLRGPRGNNKNYKY